MTEQPGIDAILRFIKSCGLSVSERELHCETFMPGIHVVDGVLCVDRQQLTYPGDLLHEAGHLAMQSPQRRAVAGADFSGNDGCEMGAIAWSYAACLHIGLSPEVLFHDDGYKGEAGWLRENFANGNYLGANLLEWKGLTNRGGVTYPNMLSWLAEH